MIRSAAHSVIRRTAGWVLVMLYDDGELGCLDATTLEAEYEMRSLPDCVVGIYHKGIEGHFRNDLQRVHRTKLAAMRKAA